MPDKFWKYAKYANFAMSFGVTMVVSLLLGYYGGNWLDCKYGTSPLFLIIGLLGGTALAFYSMVKELMALDKNHDSKNKQKDE